MAELTHKQARYPWLSPGVWVGALVPVLQLGFEAARGKLGADPVAISLNRLGLTALILLLASLSATPLRLVFAINWPMRLRRQLGLLAFFYASLHFLVYACVDQGLALSAIASDVAERKFISVGFAAFVLLIPLAITSTARMRKRLGGARWQRLHRLVYAAGLLACLHFVWRVKRDLSQPLMYAALLGVLLLVRVVYVNQKRKRAVAT
jgi:methionine sulfoxide reductase heme-binding subunit